MWHRGLMIQLVSVALLVPSPARLSGLRNWCCHSLDLIPGLGTSIGYMNRKKRKKKKRRRRRRRTTKVASPPQQYQVCTPGINPVSELLPLLFPVPRIRLPWFSCLAPSAIQILPPQRCITWPLKQKQPSSQPPAQYPILISTSYLLLADIFPIYSICIFLYFPLLLLQEGGLLLGYKVGSCLTLGNELLEEAYTLTKQKWGSGTGAESRRVKEPRRTALPCGSKFYRGGVSF